MAEKVYVITKGIYSDYHICAVTLDRNRAERLKKLLDDNCDEANIEEYIPEEAKENGTLYYVEFPEDEAPILKVLDYTLKFDSIPCVEYWVYPTRVFVCAKDEAHAMKIAQDEYARWKAEKEGVV